MIIKINDHVEQHSCPVCSKDITRLGLVDVPAHVQPAYFVLCRADTEFVYGGRLRHYEYCCSAHKQEVITSHEMMGCKHTELNRSQEFYHVS